MALMTLVGMTWTAFRVSCMPELLYHTERQTSVQQRQWGWWNDVDGVRGAALLHYSFGACPSL